MNIRFLAKVSGITGAALLAMTSQAEAAGTTGTLIRNITSVINGFPGILSASCYLLGLYYAITGVFKFKDHVDTAGSGREVPLSAAVKRFLGGGMLLSAPYMSGAAQGTLLGGGGPLLTTSGIAGGGTSAADQMVINFITDIASPAMMLLVVFGYISAIILLIVGILRLMKSEQEGPRGPAGLGTMMTFLASGALFSFADMAGVASNSIFRTSNAATIATISPNVLPAADAAQVGPLIDSLMVFIMIVGLIAFMRGWFVLKAFADGNSQVSLAQALTFLIGGAMAINLGSLVNVLQASVGINGITFN